LQHTRDEALTKDAKTVRSIDKVDSPPSASGVSFIRNMLWLSVMSAKCSLLVPGQNLVTYNAIVNIFPRNVLVLHSMKSARANSLKVCGGKRPEWPSACAKLPPLLSSTAVLPMQRIAGQSRLLASIRGLSIGFSKFQKQLMQVVDFHDSFRYFHLSKARSLRVDDHRNAVMRRGTPLGVA